VVQITGESYRLKDKRRAGILARPQHNTTPTATTDSTKPKITKQEKV
jgi:hypothetical protein